MAAVGDALIPWAAKGGKRRCPHPVKAFQVPPRDTALLRSGGSTARVQACEEDV